MPDHDNAWQREREEAEQLENELKLNARVRDMDSSLTKIKYKISHHDYSVEFKGELGKLIKRAAECLDLLTLLQKGIKKGQ